MCIYIYLFERSFYHAPIYSQKRKACPLCVQGGEKHTMATPI
nr:MAG TPA: hypothetical protein [Bacteriophage sp.]